MNHRADELNRDHQDQRQHETGDDGTNHSYGCSHGKPFLSESIEKRWPFP